MEHLSKDVGAKYLKQIEEEFPTITFDQLKGFVTLNDKYGAPTKTIFTSQNMKLLYCSPSSLRYVYHALIMLPYFQETTQNAIVELGVGYGGLFMAINYFAPLLNITVPK